MTYSGTDVDAQVIDISLLGISVKNVTLNGLLDTMGTDSPLCYDYSNSLRAQRRSYRLNTKRLSAIVASGAEGDATDESNEEEADQGN
jgi:hypothetical protein